MRRRIGVGEHEEIARHVREYREDPTPERCQRVLEDARVMVRDYLRGALIPESARADWEQTCMIAVWRALETWDPAKSKWTTYVRRCVVYALISLQKAQKYRPVESTRATRRYMRHYEHPVLDPSEDVIWRDAIAHLCPNAAARETLELLLEGYSLEEIAQIRGCSRQAVSCQRKALQRRLERWLKSE